MDFTLTSPQRDAWRARFTDRRFRGVQADLAKKLAGKGGKSSDSWVPVLSHFVQGDERALHKVLADEAIADIVARGFGLDGAEALRAALRQAQGHIEDGPTDVRIPGFEDRGPVPVSEVYLPPPCGGGSIGVMGGRRVNLFPPKPEAFVAACTPSDSPLAVVVEGAHGLGRSTLLKVAMSALTDAGISWSTRLGTPCSVLMIDDWERLPSSQHAAVTGWLGPGRTVLSTSTPEAGARPFPVQTTIKLSPMPPHWALDWLQRLRPVLQHRWGLTFDLAPTRAWLEDDPFAARLAGTYYTLGVLLRAVIEGATLPLQSGPRELLQHALRRAAPGPERSFLEVGGGDLAKAITASIIARGDARCGKRDVLQAASEIAARYGATVALNGAGVFRPVSALLHPGLLSDEGELVRCDVLPLLAPAAAPAWRALLSCLVSDDGAQEALVAAALQEGDAVLRAILELPPAHLCSALPALTRVLHTAAPFQDRALWTRAFRLSACWWAHSPQRTGEQRRGVAPPAVERLCGFSPLVVLAQAAVRHRVLLPTPLAPLDVAVDLPSELRRWLHIHGIDAPSRERLDWTLSYVAPGQQPEFPRMPALCADERWDRADEHGVSHQDRDAWWRTVAVPLWRGVPEGDRFIAGTAEGSSALPGCGQQSERGIQIWCEALAARARAGDHRVIDALIVAVERAFRWGGLWLHKALVGLPQPVRRLLPRAHSRIAEQMLSLHPQWWWESSEHFPDGRSLLSWILCDVLQREELEAVWASWAAQHGDALPWRTFVRAGIPAVEVVSWAFGGGEEGLRDRQMGLPELLGAPESSVERSRRMIAVEELAQGDDVTALIWIYAGPVSWELRNALRPRIAALGPREAPRDRIEAALAAPRHEGDLLIANLLPTEAEAALWQELIEQTDSPAIALGWVAQWCAGQSGADRWADLHKALDLLESAWTTEPTARGPYSELESFQMNGGGWLARQVARTDLPGPEDRHDLLRRLLGSPVWGPAFAGGDGEGVWALAKRILPEEEFMALLVADLRSPWGHDSRPAKLWALARDGHFDLVVELLTDPALGSAAAQVLSGLNFHDRTWPLTKLAVLTGEGAPQLDGVCERIAILALRHTPEDTVRWLRARLASTSPEVAVAWWEAVLPEVPASGARSLALEAYFEAVRDSSTCQPISGSR